MIEDIANVDERVQGLQGKYNERILKDVNQREPSMENKENQELMDKILALTNK